MAVYKVYYKGFYLVEAETAKQACLTDREDYEVKYEEYRNIKAEKVEVDE